MLRSITNFCNPKTRMANTQHGGGEWETTRKGRGGGVKVKGKQEDRSFQPLPAARRRRLAEAKIEGPTHGAGAPLRAVAHRFDAI